MKRAFDCILSLLGLIVLLPVCAAVTILIKIEGRASVFFSQERIGKDFRPFKIYKFRTMKPDADKEGPLVTASGDSRITRVGAFLRKYKLDELPQLFNILKGDMSIVGPRPEVRKYVELFESDYKKLLMVRPGLTDPASLTYSAEEEFLSLSNDEDEYVKRILPDKIRISKKYVDNRNTLADVKIIIRTFLKVLRI